MPKQPSRRSDVRALTRQRRRAIARHLAEHPRDLLLKVLAATNPLPLMSTDDAADESDENSQDKDTFPSEPLASQDNQCRTDDNMNDDSTNSSCSGANACSNSIHSTPLRPERVCRRRRLEIEKDGNCSSTSQSGDDDDDSDDGDIDNDDDHDGEVDSDDDGNPLKIKEDIRWSEGISMKPNITMLDIIAGITAIADRSNLTYTAVMEIMRFMESIVLNSTLPKTIKGLWKLLGINREKVLIRHYYCPKCLDVVGTKLKELEKCQCPEDQQSRSKKDTKPYFIQFKINPQFQRLIENPTFFKALQYRRTRQREITDIMNDTYDSKEYVRLSNPGKFLSDENNFSVTLNTDGCNVAKSSNASGWPILLQINELPPVLRKRTIILAGMWVDATHPNLTSFMAPTLRELQELFITGVEWTNPNDGSTVTSRLITTVCSVDTPVRSDILNMTRFNGMYGCTFCKAQGKTASTKNVHIYPISNAINVLRTDAEMRRIMNERRSIDITDALGIRGPSPMLLLPRFKLCSGMIVEPMHNVYLGMAKRHTMLLLDAKVGNVRVGNMSVVQMKRKIDDQLLSIRRHSQIARNTRSLKEVKNWKANEWRNWLLYYALICLKDVIVEEQLHLLSMLSETIYIYNADSISAQQLEHARDLINRYTQGYQDAFGEDSMAFNVHLLSHLPDTVENWGPLWCHSTFPFESWNKKVVDRVTSANSRPLQIATRQMLNLFLDDLLYDPAVQANTKSRVINILNHGKRTERCRRYDNENCATMNMLTFHGKGTSRIRQPETWESEALQDAGICNTVDLICFKKAVLGGVRFERYETAAKLKRHCSEYIYCNEFGFARILDIVELVHDDNTEHGFFVQLLSCLNTVWESEHISSVVLSSEKKFMRTVNKAPKPAIYISGSGGSNLSYAIALGNVWESD